MLHAEESLKAAETLLKAKLYRDSISRSYYAVYHVAAAALLVQGLEAKSHAGMRNLFSLHLVRPGKIPSEAIRMISRMQKFREEADYEPEIPFTERDAKEALTNAGSFCKEMKRFIKSQNA